MATPPIFTAGAILTAAQMNVSGLWLIKSQVVGTAVSSVTVSDVFSADFDNYKIMYNGACSSAAQVVTMQLGATATGYYGNMIYADYGGVTGILRVNDNNATSWTHLAGGAGSRVSLLVELTNPFQSTMTHISSPIYTDATNAGSQRGFLNNTTSYTAFTLAIAGTITGGTISVYGYRK